MFKSIHIDSLSRYSTAVVPIKVDHVKKDIKKMDPRVKTHVLSSLVFLLLRVLMRLP